VYAHEMWGEIQYVRFGAMLTHKRCAATRGHSVTIIVPMCVDARARGDPCDVVTASIRERRRAARAARTNGSAPVLVWVGPPRRARWRGRL